MVLDPEAHCPPGAGLQGHKKPIRSCGTGGPQQRLRRTPLCSKERSLNWASPCWAAHLLWRPGDGPSAGGHGVLQRCGFGKTMTQFKNDSPLVPERGESVCWMSHNDYISQLPGGFVASAWSAHCPAAAMENPGEKAPATQFPSRRWKHTQQGQQMFHNFLYNICSCAGDWEMILCPGDHRRHSGAGGGQEGLCGLSMGVDSSVAAMLVHKAIGKNLTLHLRGPACCAGRGTWWAGVQEESST